MYYSGKAFAYDCYSERGGHLRKEHRQQIKYSGQSSRPSLKGIRLLFIDPYAAGARDSKKYVNPDITKVSVTMKGSPSKVYGIEGHDMLKEISSNMDLKKFYAGNKFGLLIDLRSMANTTVYGSSVRLVNIKDDVFLKIEGTTSGSENLKCHVFTISHYQMNILDRQFHSVQC